MPDITMCMSETCDKKERCYRCNAIPDKYQSYADFSEDCRDYNYRNFWRNMQEYIKPYPTIGDLIKGKDYDYVSYRVLFPGAPDDYGDVCGCFAVNNGKIVPLDGDSYEYDEDVIMSEEWCNPKVDVLKGLTVIVEGDFITNTKKNASCKTGLYK